MAVKGFAADNKAIVNPVAFLESFFPALKADALIRAASIVLQRPFFVEDKSKDTGMLSQNAKTNQKTYQNLIELDLARVSASGVGNNCWFDSFLQCVSPKQNSLSLLNRSLIAKRFREWCGIHASLLQKQQPKILIGTPLFQTEAEFTADIKDEDEEIDIMTGFVIAWFFGFNLVQLRRDKGRLRIVCESSYQSPDCKAIFMYHTGNHFEPLVELHLDDSLPFKSVFSWKDDALCGLKTLNTLCTSLLFDNTWKQPTNCSEERTMFAEEIVAAAGNASSNSGSNTSSVAPNNSMFEHLMNLQNKAEEGDSDAIAELMELAEQGDDTAQEILNDLGLANNQEGGRRHLRKRKNNHRKKTFKAKKNKKRSCQECYRKTKKRSKKRV